MLQNQKANRVVKTFGRLAADMAVGLIVQNAIWMPGTKLTARRDNQKRRATANTALALGSYAASLAAIKKADDMIVSKMNPQATLSMQDIADEVGQMFDEVCDEMFAEEEEKEEKEA